MPIGRLVCCDPLGWLVGWADLSAQWPHFLHFNKTGVCFCCCSVKDWGHETYANNISLYAFDVVRHLIYLMHFPIVWTTTNCPESESFHGGTASTITLIDNASSFWPGKRTLTIMRQFIVQLMLLIAAVNGDDNGKISKPHTPSFQKTLMTLPAKYRQKIIIILLLPSDNWRWFL